MGVSKKIITKDNIENLLEQNFSPMLISSILEISQSDLHDNMIQYGLKYKLKLPIHWHEFDINYFSKEEIEYLKNIVKIVDIKD